MLTDTKIKINLEEKYLLAVNQIVMPNAAIDDDWMDWSLSTNIGFHQFDYLDINELEIRYAMLQM